MNRTRPELPDLDLESVARTCVRHPGSHYPDLLAAAATRGRLDAAGLSTLARRAAADPGTRLPRRPDPEALAWFALVSATRVQDDVTLRDVCDQLLLAHRCAGREGLGARFRDLWLDALFLSGRVADYPYPREPGEPGGAAWRVRVDELNPHLGRTEASQGGAEPWLTALSEVFTVDGLAPVRLAAGASSPLSRVRADAPGSESGDDPLVSVVLPVFDTGGDDLRLAVGSILAQSWTRLELLLCDDGSGPETRALIDELAAADPRVRVLRNSDNAGAYAAMNLGLAGARGDIVTFHGSDDWAHPERLRRQVQELMEDRSLVATTSRMVRVDPDLGVTVLGYPAMSANASSLLFWREPVLQRLGGFDPVRRAADNEFLGRLRAAFGPRSVRSSDLVLALVQRTPGSLSRADMRLLFRHPEREHYRFCYRQWHRLVREGAADPFVTPGSRPPVPAGERITGLPASTEHQVDLALLGGFAPGTPTVADGFAEVDALRRAGSLALVPLPGPDDLCVPARGPQDAVAELVRSGAVDWVLPGARVAASLVVIRDPASVLWLGDALAGVRAGAVLLVAGQDPSGRYDPGQVETLVAQMVDARRPVVRWLPATPSVRESLLEQTPAAHVLPPQRWGAVPAPDPATWDRVPRPVVGMLPPSPRTRRAELADWASAVLPRDEGVEVLTSATVPGRARRVGRPVRTLRRRNALEDVLNRAAYVVVPPSPGRAAHLHPGLVAAIRRGCVPLLDPSYREHLGAAALYVDDRGPDEWIALHLQHPALYEEQQDRAAAFLTSTLGPDVLTRTVEEVLGVTARAARPRRWLPAGPERGMSPVLRRGARAAARRLRPSGGRS